MAENKIKLTKADRRSVMLRSQFLQGSWNYERMQNGGWAYSLIPALKKLYPNKDDASAALKRHLEFFNTHPYIAAPILGVTLALEEERANGAQIDDAAIQEVKVGIIGPLFFFFVWNIVRVAFLWYTQEFGYQKGSEITKDLSGGILQTITKGASILGMFVMGILVQRWTNINFPMVISKVKLADGAFIKFPEGAINGAQLQEVLTAMNGGVALSPDKVTTLQDNLNQLIPGFAALLLTFLCMWLLKKKVNPIAIIFGLFAVGILGHLVGIF